MRKWVMPSCADRWRRVRKYFPLVSEKAFHNSTTGLSCWKVNTLATGATWWATATVDT